MDILNSNAASFDTRSFDLTSRSKHQNLQSARC